MTPNLFTGENESGLLSSFIHSFRKQWLGQSLPITWLSVSTWEAVHWNKKWCWRSGLWHI